MMVITNQYLSKVLSMTTINIMKGEVIMTKKKLSIKQYLGMTNPYLSDLINENKAIGTSSNE